MAVPTMKTANEPMPMPRPATTAPRASSAKPAARTGRRPWMSDCRPATISAATEASSATPTDAPPSAWWCERWTAAMLPTVAFSGSVADTTACPPARCSVDRRSRRGAARASDGVASGVLMSVLPPPPAARMRSVARRVVRHESQHRVAAAQASQRRAPQVGRAGEQVDRERRGHDPRLLLELVLQLPGAPPRVAAEDAHVLLDRADSPGIVVRPQEADAAEGDGRRVVGIVELGQRHDGLRLHGAALVHGLLRVDELGEDRH